MTGLGKEFIMFTDRLRSVGWQAVAVKTGYARLQSAARRQDALLDEALMETFPASDPISVIRVT